MQLPSGQRVKLQGGPCDWPMGLITIFRWTHFQPILNQSDYISGDNDGFLSFLLIIWEVTYLSKCTCLACLLVTVVTPSMYISPCFNLTSYCQRWVVGCKVQKWLRCNGFVEQRSCTGGKEWITLGCKHPKRTIYAAFYNYWGDFFLAVWSKMSHSLLATHLL
jgi:hypothetical protein